MGVLSGLEPRRVFKYFEEISSIPRGTGNCSAISEYLVRFAREKELDYVQEKCGNVIIYVPATQGYEKSEPVILQGHMDMVCEKAASSKHDFKTEPLDINIIDDHIFARGTTLGADDGIALALALAEVDDPSAAHPPLELVFTVDEGMGIAGAKALDTSLLKGKTLINLDLENEGELLTSSAGSLIGRMSVPIKYHKRSGENYRIVISGFTGGHSGKEIGKYRANANIIMGRLLHFLGTRVKFDIISITGGLTHTGIPREADCDVLISKGDSYSFEGFIKEFEKTIKNEYRANEHNISIYCNDMGELEENVLYHKTQERVIFLLNTVPDGVQKMSQEKLSKELVETSLNIGIMRTDESRFYLEASIRSCVTTEKYALSDKLRYLTETIGGIYEEDYDFPAWEYRDDSPITNRCKKIYTELFGREPKIIGRHVGLECGIFFSKIPNVDMVSIGPDILDIHTDTEKLSISSTLRTWNFLLSVLRSMC